MSQSVMRNNENSGFTLIELMMVVAIIAILGALAYPSYVRYEKRGNASAAEQFMLTVANAEDQYMLDARGYAQDNGTTNGALNTLGLYTTLPTKVKSNYTITVTPNPPGSTSTSTYLITATPIGASQGGYTDGITLTLDNTGNKGISPTTNTTAAKEWGGE